MQIILPSSLHDKWRRAGFITVPISIASVSFKGRAAVVECPRRRIGMSVTCKLMLLFCALWFPLLSSAEIADTGTFTIRVVGPCRRAFGGQSGLEQLKNIRQRQRCAVKVGISPNAQNPASLVGTKLRLVAVTRIPPHYNTGRRIRLAASRIDQSGSGTLSFRWNNKMCWFLVLRAYRFDNRELTTGIDWLTTMRAANTDQCDCAGEPCT